MVKGACASIKTAINQSGKTAAVSTYRVLGSQGSPLARCGGERFVCIWREHLKFGHYCDPGALPGKEYWERQVALIRKTGIVILTFDDPAAREWRRLGYVAAWEVSDVRLSDRGLELRLVRCLGSVTRGSGGNLPRASLPQAA